ncbi:hypothetical protein [Streptomyces sp. CRN 30]|uniref:hypothetical protein n=1 Tax=Streptomyces sp. CRN 30 TaxID=3075613 RepID=UPI002A81A538|nr:hypothetical protein [Streptomyces sp. CRN 30]
MKSRSSSYRYAIGLRVKGTNPEALIEAPSKPRKGLTAVRHKWAEKVLARTSEARLTVVLTRFLGNCSVAVARVSTTTDVRLGTGKRQLSR